MLNIDIQKAQRIYDFLRKELEGSTFRERYPRLTDFYFDLNTALEDKNLKTENLNKWFDQDWVRIDTQGNITGPCGTMKNKKNPSRCLPRAKANSLTKAERAATARKKKAAGRKGKTVVPNTEKAKVVSENKVHSIKKKLVAEMFFKILSEKKDDRCTRIAKQKYDTWPSAYASAAVTRCRQGKIWKKK